MKGCLDDWIPTLPIRNSRIAGPVLRNCKAKHGSSHYFDFFPAKKKFAQTGPSFSEDPRNGSRRSSPHLRKEAHPVEEG
ncbi:hypothetical protein J3R74_003012 [Puniceicoccus vermicola]